MRVRSDGRMKAQKNGNRKKPRSVTLQMVAERVGLTKGTCSAVLNKSAASRSVPLHTQERILTAARELNYKPSFYALNLRVKRTYMIGVVAEEIGDFYGSLVISGIERYLRQQNFSYLTVAHHHDPKLLDTISPILMARAVKRLITVKMTIHNPL